MRSKVAGGTGFAGTNTLVCLANLVVAKLYTKDTPLKTYQFLHTVHPSYHNVSTYCILPGYELVPPTCKGIFFMSVGTNNL